MELSGIYMIIRYRTFLLYIPTKRNSDASYLMLKHRLIHLQVQNTLVFGTDYLNENRFFSKTIAPFLSLWEVAYDGIFNTGAYGGKRRGQCTLTCNFLNIRLICNQ